MKTAGAAAGVVVQGTRMAKRIIADEKLKRKTPRQPITDWRYVHEILSCLISLSYARDKGTANPEDPLESLHYVRVNDPLYEFPGLSDLVEDQKKPYPRLMLLRRKGLGPNGGYGRVIVESNARGQRQYKCEMWPLYVVAIRGTIDRADMLADVHIVAETLVNQYELYENVFYLLAAISKKHGREDVWVAGHSLGAALALLAIRRLANPLPEDKARGVVQCVLTAHLFNLPFVSLDVLSKKLAIGMVNGLGALAGKTLPIIGNKVNRGIRRFGAFVVRTTEETLRSVIEVKFAKLFAEAADISEVLRDQEFRPHLYVNPKDFICNGFIADHWNSEESEPPVVSTALPIVIQLFNAESCHLIPSAYLHINHWATGFWEAHKLHQWYLYPLVNMTSEKVG